MKTNDNMSNPEDASLSPKLAMDPTITAATTGFAHPSRRYRIGNEHAFALLGDDVPDAQTKYWLGFVWADGHVDKYAIPVKLQARDIAHLEQLRDYVQTDTPISRHAVVTKNGTPAPQGRLTICSKDLVNNITTSGLVIGDKNSLMQDMPLPSELWTSLDFWRGVFDGNGTVRWAKTRGNRQPTLSLVSGLRPIREGLMGFFAQHPELSEFTGYWRPCSHTDVARQARSRTAPLGAKTKLINMRISLGGRQAMRLAQILYLTADLKLRSPYLNRKGETVLDFLSWQPREGKMLSDDEVREIREALRAGIPQKDIAMRFMVSRATICNINRGKSYGGVCPNPDPKPPAGGRNGVDRNSLEAA